MTLTLECYPDNIIDLPSSFGATSGGGLWRVYAKAKTEALTPHTIG